MFSDFEKNNKGDDDDGGGNGFPQRKMFKGDWKCADCGTEITELPFEPAPDRPIYCRECYAKRRPPRRFR